MGESIPFFLGQICWFADEPHGAHKSKELLEHEFDGEHCSVTVSYIAYSDAVQAIVEVTVVKEGGFRNDLTYVWGSILAYCSHPNYEKCVVPEERG